MSLQENSELGTRSAEQPVGAPRAELPVPKHVKVIEPPSGWPALNLAEVWRYRDLLLLLIWRDISANYRQSVIGYGWALFKSVTQTAVGTLVFGVIAGLDTKQGVPYPLLIFVGLLPWSYFSNCLTGSSNSVVNSSGLLTKVYFPRLILPLTSLGSGLVDFGIQFAILLLVLPFYVTPGWTILLAPLFLAACMLTALSVGLWLTALNVKYRDVGQLVPFLGQLWMWLTPVYYMSEKLRSKIGPEWGWVVGLNPMAGVVEGFRWAMLGSAPGIEPPDWKMMAVSFVVVALLFVSGLYYFRRLERTFADLI